MVSFSEDEQAAYVAKFLRQRERFELLNALLDVVKIENYPILEVDRGKSKTRKNRVMLFKWDPFVLPMEVNVEMAMSLQFLAHHSINASNIHGHLTIPQRDVQLDRHLADSILSKIMRQENPHTCWLALNLSETVITIEACLFLDPQEVTFPGKKTMQSKDGQIEIPVTIDNAVEAKSLFTSPAMQRHGLASDLVSMLKLYVYHSIKRDIVALVPFSVLARSFFMSKAVGFEDLGLTRVEVQPRKQRWEDKDKDPVEFYFFLMVFTFARLFDQYEGDEGTKLDRNK